MPTTAEVNTAATEFIADTVTADSKINDAAGTVVDRHGTTTNNLQKIFQDIGYQVPVAFTSGLSPADGSFTVEESGVVYGAKPSAIPFTTTGSFVAGEWLLIDAVNGVYNQGDTGAVNRSVESRLQDQASLLDFGATGDGVADDTTPVSAALSTSKKITEDPTRSFKIGTISLNDPLHVDGTNFVLDGAGAGFDVDTAITGFTLENVSLTGDGILGSAHKGLTSNSALTNAYFLNVFLKDMVQCLDLNSAVNTRFIGGVVEGAVGESSGQGYGIIAGSSSYGVFSSTLYKFCQRHALYLNNALYTAVTGNVFTNHRDVLGFATGGGLGALQIAGEATAIAENGNVYANNKGPEIVVSPQPSNTTPLKCVSLVGGAHYNGLSASVRVGGATPSATELAVGLHTTSKMFMPNIATSGGLIQIYAGFGISFSYNQFYLKDGTGAAPTAIAIGLTTPNALLIDDISIVGNVGTWTKTGGGNAAFVTIASEICLGLSRITVLRNSGYWDREIDYAVRPTNPNIITDHTRMLSVTLPKEDGTHDGSTNASALTDTAAPWSTDELVGFTINNVTDGSSGTITANTTTTVTATLSGGTDDDWDVGDTYSIDVDLNVAGYNVFEITGHSGGSIIKNFTNGYKDKAILIKFKDSLVSMSSIGNKSLAGSFSSTNKDVMKVLSDGTTWSEQRRSANT